jgi:hypothetical protein
VLESLLPYSISIKEESPIYRLKLDRKKVIDATAASPASDTKPIDDFLKELSGSQLPANVAAELASWTSLAEKVTLFEKVALIELRGDSQQRERVLHDLGDLVVDRRLQNFLVVKEPERAFSCLETKEHIPARVVHGADGFSVCEGAFAPPKGSAQSAQAKKAAVKQPEKVTMDVQDVVCYKVQHKPFLAALKEHFAQKAEHEVCVVQGDLLVLSASLLPQLRSALRKLSGKFDVANS